MCSRRTLYFTPVLPSDGATLAVTASRQFNLEGALNVCLALVRELREAHSRLDPHHGFKPTRIDVAPDGAISVRAEVAIPPAYMAPEQTGRMRRGGDYRSDYYSLGMLFYELLTGRLAFETDDVMELIYSHIARAPIAPFKINPEVPQQLSDIVVRLLAKNAEDRYQSLEGLQADCERCRNELLTTGTVSRFVLGERDISDRLMIPQRLYGREHEVRQMVGALERVTVAGAELLLVTGYSGIGKSSLVNEIQKPVIGKRGYFIAGKFDQFKRTIPYSAITQALRELMRQILTESETRICEWRDKLLKALGPNGALIINAVPELEHLIGRQPHVSQSGAEPNLYSYVMQNFIGVFTQAKHPLVLFLDDLQWADAASLNLIRLLLKDLDEPRLLLIGAYRDNEVDAGHPMMLTIDEIRKIAVVSTIELIALPQVSVTRLIADTVRGTKDSVLPLSHLIYRKTLGNPFFVRRFLQNLYNEGLLRFAGNGWRWDIRQIEAQGITDNVVDLLTKELRRLPESTQFLLNLAACIGNRFDIATLATVSERTEDVAVAILRPAIYAGLIRISDGGAVARVVPDTYVFLHDRVQQAAYEGIPRQEKKAVHLKIGQLLLHSVSPEQRDERIFDIVHQLNEGRVLLDGEQSRDELARLNLRAAKKARMSAAFDVHREFVDIARELGRVSDWSAKQRFMHELYMELVRGAFARAEYAEMERLCQIVCDNSATPHEAIVAKNMLILCYGALYRPQELLRTGVEAMTLANIKVPQQVGWSHVVMARIKLQHALGDTDPLDLALLPPATDPQFLLKLQATTAFLAYGFTYLADSNVVLWVALEIIRETIKYGQSPAAAYAFQVWGRTLAGRLGHHVEGYKFGKLAVLVSSDRALGSIGIFQGIIRHHQEHLQLSLQPLMDAYVRAMAVGDRVGAMVALSFSDSIRYQSGGNLQDALEHIRKDIGIYHKMDYPALLGVMIPWALLFARLVGVPADDVRRGMTMEDYATARKVAEDPWGIFYVRAIQCQGEYYFGEFSSAQEHAREAIALPGFDFGTPSSGFLMFFYSLSFLALCNRWDEQAKSAVSEVEAMQRRLKVWAEHAPMNYLHKWQLVEAERNRVMGRTTTASKFYDLAIQGAVEHAFVNDEALAHELAGKFYAGIGKELFASAHLARAHAKYLEWGALAKASQLESAYPALLAQVIESRRSAADAGDVTSEQRLDIGTILKASQTLSEEIQFDNLLEKLMRLLIENAGAQKGVLLLQKDNSLNVQARIEADEIDMRQGQAVEESTELSIGIINYVRRTHEKIVLGNAGADSRFNSDDYIQRAQPKSVLCIPLKKQSELVGLLYLENNLTIDAFTPAHTELLEILSTQIAISLENAELYSGLEHKIAARTRALSQTNSELSQTLSSLRQMQKQLVESEKLASLGQLVAGVAHEINTPVGIGVTGASTLAEETAKLQALYRDGSMKRSDLDHYVAAASTISKLLLANMERAAQLIQSFKEVAIDQTSEERRTFRLKAYIDDVLLNLHPMLRKADHSVTVDCDGEIEIDTYPGALSQILTNFVMNALLHAFGTRRNGSMAIVVREPDADSIELRFSDDGDGIPADILPKIFEPFFTTMRGRGGSGLGLNIVHNLVTASLQGQIRASSETGAGTTFTLLFPRNPARDRHPAAEAPGA